MKEPQQCLRIIKSASLRTRFTPTFYHHDIFGNQETSLTDSHVRVTPTFLSTVFNCDGYHIQTHHSRTLRVKQQPKGPLEAHIYVNESRQRKQASLNPCMDYGCPEEYRSVRRSDQKERLADDINHLGGRTSRLRKCVEQMSNPIFGGYTWTPFLPSKQQQEQMKSYDPNQYRYGRTEGERQLCPQKKNEKKQQLAPPAEAPNPRSPEKKQPPEKQPIKAASKSTNKHANNLKKFKSASNLHSKPK